MSETARTPTFATDGNTAADALGVAGRDERLRGIVFETLRQAERRADNPAAFRERVRWPLVCSLLRDVERHRVVLDNGLVFDVGPASRIEKALLLSPVAHPDHVWEPQTTRLLTMLGRETANVIVGGAYIGDQVVLLARSIAGLAPSGVVHAFEPMTPAFERLLHHLRVNGIRNVSAHRLALWSRSHVALRLEGELALASATPVNETPPAGAETAGSISIDDYVLARGLRSVGLVMLDTEGGEEPALLGARRTIARDAPHIVFEVHRQFVDWSGGLENTSIVALLTSQGYTVYAIRDCHGNHPMAGAPIEIIPVASVHLDGPPHGFNMLATRDGGLADRLQLRLVEHVSPKLLLEGDAAVHLPIFTKPAGQA